MKVERTFTRDNIKGACPKIPQQSNYTDCGLYLLQFAEHFFKVWFFNIFFERIVKTSHSLKLVYLYRILFSITAYRSSS